ncbi:hypothetical protein C4D60_Mb05t15930 [Musa balbisiana]|uniref:Uncharacterized protein n=1 Tax=Musa balbisiana TaxID=52838 RepID=A0A4S8JWG8_MUSBA|nr:hypothetical protein C4D60_Mb05t15930 [Musa balbisiana]
MPDCYWCLFNDLGLSPPGLTIGPSVVTPEVFFSLTKQVQAMAGMMQTLALIIPQIVRQATLPTDPTWQHPSGEQVRTGEAREQATDSRGPPGQNVLAPYRVTLPHLEPHTVSSNSADDSLRAQLSWVN